MKVNILNIVLALSTIMACQNEKDTKPVVTAPVTTPVQEAPAPVVNPKPNSIGGKSAVLGSWQGTEWLLKGEPSGMDAKLLHFDFRENGTYDANFGPQHKSGTWRVLKDTLYTTETGKKELPIKVLKNDETSLHLELNLKGQKEVWKFKKQ